VLVLGDRPEPAQTVDERYVAARVSARDYDIFDCHHHVGDVSAFLGVTEAETGSVRSEVDARTAIMDTAGVAQAAVIPSHAYERPDGIADTRHVNDGIAAYRAALPDRFPVAIGIVEPQHGMQSLAELDRVKHDLALDGISFHARFQGVSMDDPSIMGYVERMTALQLVPVLHAMTESPDESLWKIAAIASAFPDVPMLVLDSFSTWEGTKESSAVAERCPNLLFDTSLSYNFDFIELFAQRFGADRVVFGTDLYSPPIGRRISHLVPQILASSLCEADKAAILGGNARRLFGIERPLPH
jgi:predicted TIM-barrel fold metal-dependent hydrolase